MLHLGVRQQEDTQEPTLIKSDVATRGLRKGGGRALLVRVTAVTEKPIAPYQIAWRPRRRPDARPAGFR